jgi:hypothetical protein
MSILGIALRSFSSGAHSRDRLAPTRWLANTIEKKLDTSGKSPAYRQHRKN